MLPAYCRRKELGECTNMWAQFRECNTCKCRLWVWVFFRCYSACFDACDESELLVGVEDMPLFCTSSKSSHGWQRQNKSPLVTVDLLETDSCTLRTFGMNWCLYLLTGWQIGVNGYCTLQKQCIVSLWHFSVAHSSPQSHHLFLLKAFWKLLITYTTCMAGGGITGPWFW